MTVYRLARASFCRPLTGAGAAIKGARWNSIGVEMIYTGSSRALAMAEIAVHFTLATLPDDYMMCTIEISDNLIISSIDASSLPLDWKNFPSLSFTKDIGDTFIRDNQFAVLKVPSAVVQGDFNFLINPRHADFQKIRIEKIEKFPFDERILKQK